MKEFSIVNFRDSNYSVYLNLRFAHWTSAGCQIWATRDRLLSSAMKGIDRNTQITYFFMVDNDQWPIASVFCEACPYHVTARFLLVVLYSFPVILQR